MKTASPFTHAICAVETSLAPYQGQEFVRERRATAVLLLIDLWMRRTT